MSARKLTAEQAERRDQILSMASILHARRLSASPWRRRLARRRQVARMGWWRS